MNIGYTFIKHHYPVSTYRIGPTNGDKHTVQNHSTANITRSVSKSVRASACPCVNLTFGAKQTLITKQLQTSVGGNATVRDTIIMSVVCDDDDDDDYVVKYKQI